MLNLSIASRDSISGMIYVSNASAENFELSSLDLPQTGVSILRGSGSYLLMDYGPHGGAILHLIRFKHQDGMGITTKDR